MQSAVAVFLVCAIACVVAHVFILVSVVGRRANTANPAVPRPNLVGEVLWALLPAIVLALVLTATWQRVQDRSLHKPGMMLRVAQ
jgi:heme/copper-type cytochrome/quinol oxidase subunit 2